VPSKVVNGKYQRALLPVSGIKNMGKEKETKAKATSRKSQRSHRNLWSKIKMFDLG